MSTKNTILRIATILAVLAAGACTSNVSHSQGVGGQLAVALPSGNDVTWLNPLLPGSDCTATNYATPQGFLYRPIFWVGANLKIDYSNSIADSVRVSGNGTKYVVHMKNYQWSDGKPVTARDVATYFYLLSEGAKAEDCIYGLGGMPDKVKSFKVLDDHTFEVDYNPRPSGYNPNWVELSGFPGLTALPTDNWLSRCPNTGFNPSSPTAAAAGKFWSCLKAQGGNLNWAGWKIVDGPFTLNTASTRAHSQYVFKKNPKFSGHQASLSQVVLVSEATSEDTFTSLKRRTVDVGIVPADLAPQARTLSGYGTSVATTWSASYVGLTQDPKANFPAAAAFRDRNVRIALQHGVDSTTIINKITNGVWYANNGPVPPRPNTYLDPSLAHPLYPFDLEAGEKLLDQAGYPLVNGVRRLKDGTPFKFTLSYRSGDQTKASIAQLLQSDWQKMGLVVTLRPVPAAEISAETFNAQQAREKLQAFMQVPGWAYFPDYYPTGEQLYTCGGVVASAFGSYCTKQLDQLVQKTTEYASSTDAQNALNAYQMYLAQNAVGLYTPVGVGLLAVSKSVSGIASHLTNFSYAPEYWSRS